MILAGQKESWIGRLFWAVCLFLVFSVVLHGVDTWYYHILNQERDGLMLPVLGTGLALGVGLALVLPKLPVKLTRYGLDVGLFAGVYGAALLGSGVLFQLSMTGMREQIQPLFSCFPQLLVLVCMLPGAGLFWLLMGHRYEK